MSELVQLTRKGAASSPGGSSEGDAARAKTSAGTRLRIVMLIPYDLECQPFAIRSIRFADELGKRGHDVMVFHRPALKELRGERVRVRRVHRELPDTFEVGTLRGVLRFKPSTWLALDAAIATCDVVHFQKSLPAAFAPALLLAKRHDKPLHQDWDDYESYFWLQAARDAGQTRGAKPLARARGVVTGMVRAAFTATAERLIPKLSDTVGGASSELRRRSVEFGAEPGAVFPARVGVDADVFSPAHRDLALRAELGLSGPTVLFSGSFDMHPELLFFVDAIKRLVRDAPGTKALVVGGGFGRRWLQDLVHEHGLSRSVTMTSGFVPFADMPRYVASCDIAALPFRDTRVNRGKSSLTLLECMASGVPVVTHDVGDVRWMMGDGGEIAPPDDPDAFGARLAALARDPERRRTLGEAGRTRAIEQFSWARTVDELEAAYRACIVRHGGAR